MRASAEATWASYISEGVGANDELREFSCAEDWRQRSRPRNSAASADLAAFRPGTSTALFEAVEVETVVFPSVLGRVSLSVPTYGDRMWHWRSGPTWSGNRATATGRQDLISQR